MLVDGFLQDCLDALQKAQEPLSQAQLEAATGHDCSEGSVLSEHLAKNPKIGFGEGRYRFKVRILAESLHVNLPNIHSTVCFQGNVNVVLPHCLAILS